MTELNQLVKHFCFEQRTPENPESSVTFDTVAYRQSISLPREEILRQVTRMLSPQVTSALLDLHDRRSLSRWQRGISMPPHLESRLRFVFHLGSALEGHAPSLIFSAWLVAPNPALNDLAPLIVLRDTDFYSAGTRLLSLMRSLLDGQIPGQR